MSSTKFLLATSSLFCLTLAANVYSADSSANLPALDTTANSRIDFRAIKQSRNPVIKALDRHNAFSKEQDLEYYLEHVLGVAQATPDYVKGFGADRPTSPENADEQLPRLCKLATGELDEWYENERSHWNVVFWDGASLDSTGTRPLINGTNNQDIIIGTVFSDLIYGLGEHDFICSLGGDDTVFGDGPDWASTLDTDRGDIILGGPGDDTLYGGGWSDVIIGGSGHDTLLGGNGLDQLEGDDRGIYSGTELPIEFHGDDFMVGMENLDDYYGQGGNDTVNSISYSAISNIDDVFHMDKNDGFTDSCFVFDEEKAGAGGCEIINEY